MERGRLLVFMGGRDSSKSLLALVLASIFTSIVTNDISDIRRVHSVLLGPVRQQEAEKQVADYIRITTEVHPPGKNEMATLLPDFLYRELCREAWSPLLAKHDFLLGLEVRYAAFYTEVCVECISDWNVAPQEVLFSFGRKCSAMLFVASGEVFYRLLP
ncbi:hypothetical protein AK812_SmicGene23051 [Symbiodinium microadriaticum]|uniref:Uncharacterized protein n=1 Tax=Symbiodinium microadriaticum TaxID=2951 RepID=A0A1Q9DI83_SYMMI|nr:hypothetical protein AK812_SmicGene23051 [Symbiodinium microadriaticum]